MLIAVAAAALALTGDPDGVVSTAPRGEGAVLTGAVAPTTDASPNAALAGRVTAQDLTTQEQIDRWIAARAPEAEPFADAGPGDDRQMHGFVSGTIGTNDYSDVSVGVSLPIGDNGRLDLAYSQTKNGYGYPGYGYGSGYGYGYGGFPSDYGYHTRPFGARGAFRDATESGRSVALGFSWDQDKSDDRRASPRRGRVTAAD